VLAAASVLAIADVATIASSAVTAAALVDLGAITECDDQDAMCPDEDHQQLLHDPHWRLREQINGIVGYDPQVKARGPSIAFKYDPGTENEGAAAGVDLAQSYQRRKRYEQS
jgi:hypothetical protein